MRHLLPLIVLLSACTGETDTDTDVDTDVDTDTDTGEALTEPDIEVSACAPQAYDWVPFDQVGQIVSAEAATDLSIDQGTLNIALSAAGLGELTPVPYGVRSWRVRYTTQDKGQVVEATTVISMPDVAEQTDFPSVVWAHGTTGLTDECAPSAGGAVDNIYAIVVASQGYAVTAPDYIGMNGFGDPAESLHPYLVVEPAAVGTLDSVRALWNLEAAVGEDLPANPTSRLGLWGGSEGGFHVLWADRYAEHYLPQAELVATVAAVPPSDVRGIADVAVQGEPIAATGALFVGMAGMASWQGNTGRLSEVLNAPYDAQILTAVSESCDLGSALDGAEGIDDIVKADVLADMKAGDWPEPFACHLDEGVLRDSTVPRTHDTPVFFQVSGADDLVVASVIRDDAALLCDAGYRVDYLECAGAGHSEGAAQSIPQQLAWLRARMDGEEMTIVCDLDDVRSCGE